MEQKHEEWRERDRDDDRSECARTVDKASHKAEDQVKLIRESRVECHDTSAHPLQLHSTYFSFYKHKAFRFTFSLTDLAVAEMYWTTISRLVLKSFPRRGALRSSFRFMSS